LAVLRTFTRVAELSRIDATSAARPAAALAAEIGAVKALRLSACTIG
jgi:hypothetical protein